MARFKIPVVLAAIATLAGQIPVYGRPLVQLRGRGHYVTERHCCGGGGGGYIRLDNTPRDYSYLLRPKYKNGDLPGLMIDLPNGSFCKPMPARVKETRACTIDKYGAVRRGY